ncbi:guanylate kinase [Candidatus Woesearchaeota archaeon]|nr:guanylate kinase [Candidatus Woesearchaeota archaeon]
MYQGTLYVVSAPSGAGKTSLVRALGDCLADMVISVSHTTRAERPGEIEGREYFFVSLSRFHAMIEEGAFLEYAQVFDHFYGTALSTVNEALVRGQDVLLEIDWQGARQVRSVMPDCQSVFILPPSRKALLDRLTGRGQDQPEVIARRMQSAISESSHYAEYDYLVVNDAFDQALDALRAIVLGNRHKQARQACLHEPLITGLLR